MNGIKSNRLCREFISSPRTPEPVSNDAEVYERASSKRDISFAERKVEPEEEFDDEYGTKVKKETYKISNPSTFEDEIPFSMVNISKETEGCSPEELKELLNLPEEGINILKHFYSVTDSGKFTPIQVKAICWKFGFELVSKSILGIDPQPRPPIITIMGHVDHGKTTLLDAYRNSNLTEGEVGGITQKIGGFLVKTQFGNISFIDTPGHSLFTNMRKTGANCTDIIVLVVSGIEGVQSQTKEVLEIIEESSIPVIVAINKIDSPKADPEAVEEELFKMGVEIEPLGGNIPVG